MADALAPDSEMVLKTDLALVFGGSGDADVSWQGAPSNVPRRDLLTVSGLDNLAQALKLRILVARGEIAGLGHPDYGSRVAELIGETIDRPNLELLRRYVRKAIRSDPRVEDILSLTVRARTDLAGAVDVAATVQAISGVEVTVALTMALQ